MKCNNKKQSTLKYNYGSAYSVNNFNIIVLGLVNEVPFIYLS